MSVREITFDELPRATRNRVSPIKRTQDWMDTLAAIQGNRFEVLQVEFSRETLALGKVTPLRFKLMLESELRSMGRGDLKVMFRGWSKSGARTLYVVRRAVKEDATFVLHSAEETSMTRPQLNGPASNTRDSSSSAA